MVKIDCPTCREQGNNNEFTYNCVGFFELKGIITCLRCKHERPFASSREFIRELGMALPGEQSSRLLLTVPADIKEDVREAERANYAQCYKASVAMCRRALQLSLIDKEIVDKQLSKMLEEAKAKNILNDTTYNLATSIKGYGDIGIHRTEQLEPKEVELVIYTTVRMLNEIFL